MFPDSKLCFRIKNTYFLMWKGGVRAWIFDPFKRLMNLCINWIELTIWILTEFLICVVPSDSDYAARILSCWIQPFIHDFGIILIKTEFKRSFFQYPEGFNRDFWSKLRVFKKRRSWMLCQIRFCSRFWTWIFCFLWQSRFYQFDEVCRLNARSKTRRKSGKCRIRISKLFRLINLDYL